MATTEEEKQAFIMASENERKYIKTFSAKNPEFDVWSITSASGYSTFDCYAMSGTTYTDCPPYSINNRWAVETKVRTFDVKKYSTAYIKCYKWYRMLEKCKSKKYSDKNVQPIYMMFFSCGTVAIFNLFKAKKKYIEKKFKKYNVYDSEIVTNKLFELSFNDATFYRWK